MYKVVTRQVMETTTFDSYNQMQNIWSKAYFYQLNQPKVPHPPDDQCWLVNLGQKQHCCWGKG